jgi:hypothetical protein
MAAAAYNTSTNATGQRDPRHLACLELWVQRGTNQTGAYLRHGAQLTHLPLPRVREVTVLYETVLLV